MADDSKRLNEAMTQISNLQESISELEQLALEDRGWTKIIANSEYDRTPDGRRRISDLCEVMTIANPLIKRGFMLRGSYVWGGGHTLQVESNDNTGEEVVGEAVTKMFEDPRNAASLGTEEAQEQLERWLFTHGAIVLLCDTDEETGEIIVRQEDPDHVDDFITDPEDSRTVRFWRRAFTTRPIRKDGTPGASKTVYVWHPDIDYDPIGADRVEKIGGKDVRWDQPLLVRCVNTPATAGWTWGIPDAWAAVPWAQMVKEFLESWFTLMKALSRYAWKTSSKGSAAAAKAVQAARSAQEALLNASGAGAHVFTDPNTSLEAVPKSGATIDASSVQPLQSVVAAALDVPVTMLLGDPGTTGARAVAETLDQPMELAMNKRRRFWGGILIRLAEHAIQAGIKANKIPGTVVKYSDQARSSLPEGWSGTVTVDWPDFDSLPIDVAMKALRDADGLDVLPVEIIVSEALRILGIENPEEWIEKMRKANLLEIEPPQETPAPPGQRQPPTDEQLRQAEQP